QVHTQTRSQFLEQSDHAVTLGTPTEACLESPYTPVTISMGVRSRCFPRCAHTDAGALRVWQLPDTGILWQCT
ncbi:MAG: hypothetical protein KC492_18185, partial [Myxococcales bacterium]|nr:hypothetical protein [Myxococcales bacterium]